MNPLLATTHRRYRTTGVPDLARQALDLAAVAAEAEAERTAALVRAARGYVRARREEEAQRSIWDRKQRLITVWDESLPAMLRRQAW